jgi:DNA segregation ATPase FtsK/SpoIIIE, S-DNA-T family
MKRKKRTSKKRITYDSSESKSVLGLLFLFLGIISLLSYFIDAPAFVFVKNFFADATVFLTIFSFSTSLYIFGSKFVLAKPKSIIGQILFLISYSSFINSIFGGDYIIQQDQVILYGGYVGYYVYSFLNEYLFLDFTPIVLFSIIIISLPISISMPLSQFLDYLGNAVLWIWSKIKREKQDLAESIVEESTVSDGEKPVTFGDFRKSADEQAVSKISNQNNNQAPKQNTEDKKQVEESDATVSSLRKVPNNDSQVQIKEESVEGAYINQELLYPDWKLPPIELFNPYKKVDPPKKNIKRNAEIIEQTLRSFGVKARVVDVLIGPSVTQFALDIALGTKVSKIANLSNDLALALATSSNSLRIEAPIPGTSYVGIETPNETRSTVYSKEVMQFIKSSEGKNLPIGLGKNINGDILVLDLQKMPHILIAGATGSGKSVLTNSFIVSLLLRRTPDEVKFIMVDPKQVELSDYNGIPHLLTPVITEMEKVLNALKWAIAEMERRYTIFKDAKVRNIEGYNKLMGFSAFPYIVIVIDEMADMMMSTNKVETESAIVRLAQKARATGIHLVLATQRPSVDVITGLIKANIPARVGMSVTTQIDSRVIMDQIGAEALLGNGDLLYKDPSFGKPMRIQGMWMAPDEIQRVVKYIKDQVPEVHYTKEVVEKQVDPNEATAEGGSFSDDDLFANALRVIVNSRKGSASLLQRKLSIGYNRAARLLDELEEHGVVGPVNGSKPRDVLIDDAEAFLSSRQE